MATTPEKKQIVYDDFKQSPKDTGSSAFQVAVYTDRIQSLSEHLKGAPKDFASRRGLLNLVSQRRQHLSYLKKTHRDLYSKVIQRLDLRK